MNYQQEEFVWSATLDKKNPEHNWSPPDSDSEDIDDSIIHKLRIKNAFLSSKAKKEDEFNTIELETTGYKEEEIKCPLVMMKSSSTSQCTVDLSFNRSVKFTLTEGNGPIHLVGSHILEFGNGKEEPEDEGAGVEGGSEGEAEEEEEADEEMTEEESPPPKPKRNSKKPVVVKNGKKRKARSDDDNGDEDCDNSDDDEESKQSPKKKKIQESNGKQNKSKKSTK
ncbi:nucleoplasmin-like protein ANO39 isoform X2 [Lepeophtheirus salmonis]|uniref:nucleoplasmin-like protein ANO39 isoform X2 n=1 Tax=Lepeophtheirus salmonis TaxID=72036 RepID=UPI001AE4320E|nr:nucleoplasmin-like protein ANO39 [Lepeophtheirus salmonis]